jgi:quercetin dioxygenase-like cupin family protein
MKSAIGTSMSLSRRTFLQTTGTMLAFPAILRPQTRTSVTQEQKFNMVIKRIGSQPSVKPPAEYFTDAARIDPLFEANPPACVSGGSVTFEPGARNAWHTHPLGQILIVTAGCGWVQREGAPVEEVHPGDVIWIPPGEKHWHGLPQPRP